jgi:replicative DNA helicase
MWYNGGMIEQTILQQLSQNEKYVRKVLPFLREDYFSERESKIMFSIFQEYINKYNSLPTKSAVNIILEDKNDLDETTLSKCSELCESIFSTKETLDDKWLVDETEKFCKDRALYNAVLESIHIIDGKSKTQTKGAIPTILSNALAVSFDTHIGHDYIDDAETRFEFYHTKEKRIPFDLEMFNTITGGGTPIKTLNVVIAPTGVGKSMFLCHHAANCLTQNLNVLYITCEMAEERIAERIDANLMDISLDNLKQIPKQLYDKKMEAIKDNVKGKLIIKEYPTATGTVNHFRALLEELRLKKKFVPDVLFVDYLNICASSRFKMGGGVNTYMYVKSIAEELRGLAVEYSLPLWTATQTNREGFGNQDIDMSETSDSFGLPMTADFMFALIATEELEEMKQILVKQLKNRYNDAMANRKFILGLDRSMMKFKDAPKSAHSGILNANISEDTVAGKGFDMRPTEDKFKKKVQGWNI